MAAMALLSMYSAFVISICIYRLTSNTAVKDYVCFYTSLYLKFNSDELRLRICDLLL